MDQLDQNLQRPSGRQLSSTQLGTGSSPTFSPSTNSTPPPSPISTAGPAVLSSSVCLPHLQSQLQAQTTPAKQASQIPVRETLADRALGKTTEFLPSNYSATFQSTSPNVEGTATIPFGVESSLKEGRMVQINQPPEAGDKMMCKRSTANQMSNYATPASCTGLREAADPNRTAETVPRRRRILPDNPPQRQGFSGNLTLS
ncbi:unnamed protein product [Protopolystoma xenopodis]|uniref:Uncharacterized protein n=1 Tax=Protopolystoma xenopodis TaxID=117903 RepID=A0A448WJ64_9PLAT|nr:unnamed protein product [Protopolystoma xenopodis]